MGVSVLRGVVLRSGDLLRKDSILAVGPPQPPQVSQGSCQAQHAQERGSHGGPGPCCFHPTMQEQQPRGQHLLPPHPPCPWGSHQAPGKPQLCPLPAAVPVPKAPEPSSPACPFPQQGPGVGSESSGARLVLLQYEFINRDCNQQTILTPKYA